MEVNRLPEPRVIRKSSENCYHLEDFPRLPDETDDIGRFRRAIHAMPSGSRLMVPPGRYFLEEICIRKPISICFDKKAVVEPVHVNAPYILKWEGGTGYHDYCLAHDLKRGDRSFWILQTPWDIKAGDMIALTDDSTRWSDGQKNVNVEIHEIKSIHPSEQELLQDGLNEKSWAGPVWNHQSTLGRNASFAWDPGESALKMELKPVTEPGYVSFEQKVFGIQEGERYNLQLICRVKTSRSVTGSCYVAWYDRRDQFLSRSKVKEFDPLHWQRIVNGNLKAPSGAAAARVIVSVHALKPGDCGTLWVKGVSFKSAVTRMVLKDRVRLPKRASGQKNVYKINPLRSVCVENFCYRLKEGSSKGFGILAFNMHGFFVRGLKGERGAESAIQVQRSMDVTVEDFDLRDPQVVGSGQGYGIQFYGGNRKIVVRNGYTRRMRHSVDLEGTFDAWVENVVDEKGKGASFMISHNGWCSDITFIHCRSVDSGSSGFVAEAQGVKDPFSLKHHNIRILHCEWQRTRRLADPVCYGFGIWLKVPATGKIMHFKAMCGNGENPTALQDNGAIRLLPVGNDLLVKHVTGEGLRRGVLIAFPSAVPEQEYPGKMVFRDICLRNCRTGFLINDGEGKRVFLYDLKLDQIDSWLFEGNGRGSYEQFVLDGLKVVRSGKAGLMQSRPQPVQGSVLQGKIARIVSDQRGAFCSLKKNWALSLTDCLLKGDGETIWFSGKIKNSCARGIPDGIVEGQRLKLVSSSPDTFTVFSDNIAGGKGRGITLSPDKPSVLLVWQEKKWIPVQ